MELEEMEWEQLLDRLLWARMHGLRTKVPNGVVMMTEDETLSRIESGAPWVYRAPDDYDLPNNLEV